MITAKEANAIVETARKEHLDKLFHAADIAIRQAAAAEHCATTITVQKVTTGAVEEFLKTIKGEPWKLDGAVEFKSTSGDSPMNMIDEVRIKLFW